jgi:hypothetical protein
MCETSANTVNGGAGGQDGPGYEFVQVVVHAPVEAAGSFGLFGGEPRRGQGRQVRIVVNESHGPTLRTQPVRSSPGLTRTEGVQGAERRGGVVSEEVHGAGSAKFPGRRDHAEVERESLQTVFTDGVGRTTGGLAETFANSALCPEKPAQSLTNAVFIRPEWSRRREGAGIR